MGRARCRYAPPVTLHLPNIGRPGAWEPLFGAAALTGLAVGGALSIFGSVRTRRTLIATVYSGGI